MNNPLVEMKESLQRIATSPQPSMAKGNSEDAIKALQALEASGWDLEAIGELMSIFSKINLTQTVIGDYLLSFEDGIKIKSALVKYKPTQPPGACF